MGHDRLRVARSSLPVCILMINFLFLLQETAAFNFPVLRQLPTTKATHTPIHRCRAPTMHHACFVSEGLRQGYHLFEFVGRRLPRQFFTELGTPASSTLWMAFFLLSNVAFPIAGVKILASRERPNRTLAFFVFLVGAISTAFHWTQCSLGSGSPVVHTW
jgi:hypothetical protein